MKLSYTQYPKTDRKSPFFMFKKHVFDGTPTVSDPAGMMVGVTAYFAWFRPLRLSVSFYPNLSSMAGGKPAEPQYS